LPEETRAGGLLKLIPLALAGVALGVWALRPPSPDARAQNALARARTQVDSGLWLDAAPQLDALARDRAASEAVRKGAASLLGTLAARAVREKRPLAETAVLLEEELGVLEETDLPAEASGVTSETLSLALDRLAAEAAQDPKGACRLAGRLVPVLSGTDLEIRAREAETKALDLEIARDSSDVDALVARAGIDFAGDKIEEARARLEPVASRLGSGEGSRLLGLARLRAGDTGDAIACLTSYYEGHLPAFERATDGLHAAIESAKRRAELEPILTRKLRDARDDAERRRLFETFVGDQVRLDPEVRAARAAVVGALPLVDAALGLAEGEISTARGKPSAERDAGLERASRFLESVGAVAVGNDHWWLWVARLKLEQGKRGDLETVVESYLAGPGRRDSASALCLASQVLAEAGLLDRARARAEEAYRAARSPLEREQSAQVRARAAETYEDQEVWLEKAGSSEDTKALRAQARASEALASGKFDEAAAGFEAARAYYDLNAGGAPGPAAVHSALLGLARAEATGRDEDLTQTIARLDALVAREPAPLAALEGLADALQERAVSAVVGDRVRCSVLHDRSLDVLDLAAQDAADGDALIAAFFANADLLRSLEVRERALTDAPKRAKFYSALLAVAAKSRDAARVEGLAARLEKAAVDRTDEARALRDFWSSRDDETRRRALVPRRARADAVLALARASGHAPTIACALVARAALEREAAAFGAPSDLDLGVKLDEEALALAPRRVTRLALRNALLAREADRARAKTQALASLVEKHGKVGLVTVLSWAARADAALAKDLAAASDVKRALDLHAAAEQDGQKAPEPHDWIVFALANDPRAADAAKRVAGSTFTIALARATYLLAPESPEIVNDLATVLELRGERDARKKLLDDSKKAGVPLPYEILEVAQER
jgi:hypothetical protein